MRNRKLAITMALGALAAGCYAGYRRSQGARQARPAAKPEYLQTWEGEGGGVPLDSHHTASQVDPRERGDGVTRAAADSAVGLDEGSIATTPRFSASR